MNSNVTPEPRLRVRGVRKTFGGTAALRDVDLDVRAGEMAALVGANGAGKSTLVKIICGAYSADGGEIEVDGRKTTFRGVADALKAGIAVAHQQVAIIPTLTAAENIMLGREPLRAGLIRDSALYERAGALAARFGVDIPLMRECGDLGVGENKILDILKALQSDPALLILDEPTASLTLAESARLFSFLRELRASGLAILFISHHIAEIFAYCDRVAVLKDGVKVHDGPVAETSPEAVVRMMVGRAIEDVDWRSHARQGELAVHLSAARIGDLGVGELAVRRGEIVGVAGVLGAGQTDLLECLAGARPAQAVGAAKVNGLDRLPRSVAEATDNDIFLIADNRLKKALFPGLSVEENLLSGSLRQTSPTGFMQTRRIDRLARDMIARLSVRCAGPQQDVMQLSGGNQQKLAFGRWLLRMDEDGGRRAPLLLLDNPTEGVDVGAKADVYALIRGFAEKGAAILIASAEFGELLKLCDRIHCIADARLGAHLERGDFSEERLLLEVN